jgi:ClpP class serine protease
MSPHQYLARVISQPLAIDKVRGRTMIRALAAALLKNERPEEDVFGDPLPKMQIVGDVALIPLSGVIDMDVPSWIKSYGFAITDANDIEEEITRALNDANVRFLGFPTNSPGGSGLAAEKLFDLVEAASRKKPSFGFIADAGWACSGAYWALAACTTNYAGWYAEAIGNIGAWMSLLDDTEFWAQMGIKFEVFRSGEYKAIGEDALSEKQRAYLQQITNDCGELFRKNVAKYRTTIAAADMEGQWYKGTEAARRGFVGANCKDVNEAIAKFRRLL